MPEGKVLPTNDLCFKKLFASDQNKDVLKPFIQDIFGIAIQDVSIKNPYSIKAFNKMLKKKGGYYAIEVDTLCTTKDNWNFHLEMQLAPQRFYLSRAAYYLCTTYQATYGQEDLMKNKSKYGALNSTFSISILGFEHFKEDDKATHIFTFKDEENQKLCEPDILTMCFFELRKSQVNREVLKYWQQLFLTGEVDESAPGYIHKAVELLELDNYNKEERKMIDVLERATQDRIAREEYVKLEGREEGKFESALNMIRLLHTSVCEAMTVANLPEESRDQLIQELEKRKIPYTLI